MITMPNNFRQEIISDFTDPRSLSIVEIGALDNPTFDPRHFNVKFIDYTTKDCLIAENLGNPRYTVDKLVDVHYAVPDGDYGIIPETFELIIANHVIEHIPDMLGWLKDLHRILRPGGFLFLSVPDRRFTFDHLRPETRISEILAAHNEERKLPSWEQIFDHFYYYRKVDAKMAWGENIEDILSTPRSSISEAKRNADRLASTGKFVSLHCNVFTYSSFLGIVNSLSELNVLPFSLRSSKDVHENSNEFHVMLAAK